MNNEILEFISLCNKTWGRYPEFSGGCYKFSKLLINVFGGEMYWSHDHIMTKIDGMFYDIHGCHETISDEFLLVGDTVSMEHIDYLYEEYM